MTSHWAVLLALGFAVASTDVVQASGAAERDCFREMERGQSTEIVCEFPTQLTEDEKRDLKAITRDVLQDARCLVSIRIERRTFDEALRADDMVFEASPQPVRCEVVTLERVIPIEARFAPRVTFVAGKAVQATPGLRDVTGVPSVVAWPVVQYVNRAGSIQAGMLTVINAYRVNRGTAREALRR